MNSDKYQAYFNEAKAFDEFKRNIADRKKKFDGDLKTVRDAVANESATFIADPNEMQRLVNLKLKCQQISRSIKFSVNCEHMIVRCLNPFLSTNIRAESVVLFDPAIDNDAFPWLPLKGAKIVAGSYGIGIRANVNAHGVQSYNDVQYILAHHKFVSARLRELKQLPLADALDEVAQILWEIPYLRNSVIHIPIRRMEVVDWWNAIKTTSSIIFTHYGNFMSITYEGSDIGESIDPETMNASSYGVYRLLYNNVDSIIDQADKIATSAARYCDDKGFANKEIEHMLNDKLARWKFMKTL